MNQIQVLLHTALIDSGHVEKCGLLMRDTSEIKTTSVGYKVCIQYLGKKIQCIVLFCLQLEQSDVDTLVNAFNQPTLLRRKGLYFNEVYYTCIRADSESIYAKEVSRSFLNI